MHQRITFPLIAVTTSELQLVENASCLSSAMDKQGAKRPRTELCLILEGDEKETAAPGGCYSSSSMDMPSPYKPSEASTPVAELARGKQHEHPGLELPIREFAVCLEYGKFEEDVTYMQGDTRWVQLEAAIASDESFRQFKNALWMHAIMTEQDKEWRRTFDCYFGYHGVTWVRVVPEAERRQSSAASYKAYNDYVPSDEKMSETYDEKKWV